MLDITQDCTNKDSRTFKLQKGEFKFCESWLIKNRREVNFADFKLGPSP